MKLQPSKINSFLQKPAVEIFLLYGPDHGLVKERGEYLAKQIVPDLSDAFQVSQLHMEDILQTPSKLADEVLAQSLLGGQRVISVRGATDKIVKNLEDLLNIYQGGNRLILQADDLSPSSKLRKLAESSDKIAALPCYHDEKQQIGQLLRQSLTKEGYEIDRDALTYLEQFLGDDRLLTRQIIEKLVLYCYGQKQITFEDVKAVAADHAPLSLDDLFYAITQHHYAKADQLLTRLFDEATAEILILRSLQKSFLRLYKVKSVVEAGISLSEAISKLRPPIFYKYKPLFTKVASEWSIQQIEDYLTKLIDTELQVKSGTVQPQNALRMMMIENYKDQAA